MPSNSKSKKVQAVQSASLSPKFLSMIRDDFGLFLELRSVTPMLLSVERKLALMLDDLGGMAGAW